MVRIFADIIRKNLTFRTFLGFAISGVLLVVTIHKSGLNGNDFRLDGTQWFYFGAAVAAFVVSVWIQAVRARVLWVSKNSRLKSVDTYGGFLIGNFYNSLLPGNLGEGVRAYHFAQKHSVPFSKSLAAILTEKWIDARMFVIFVALLYAVKPFPGHAISYALVVTCSVIVFLSILYPILRTHRRLEHWIWLRIVRLGRRPARFLYRLYRHTTDHLYRLVRERQMGRYISVGMIVFFSNILQFYFLLKAAHVPAPVDGLYTASFTAVSMMVIAFIPSAPGNVGVLHYGIYLALVLLAGMYGTVPDDAALRSYALFGVCIHASYFIPEVVMGIVFVVKERQVLFNGKSPYGYGTD